MGLGPIGVHTVPFRLIGCLLYRPGAPAQGDSHPLRRVRPGSGSWAARVGRRIVDSTALVPARRVPASAEAPLRTGGSRSGGAPRDRPTLARAPRNHGRRYRNPHGGGHALFPALSSVLPALGVSSQLPGWSKKPRMFLYVRP